MDAAAELVLYGSEKFCGCAITDTLSAMID